MDKRNKRFLSLVLVLVLVIGMMPMNIASLGDDTAEQKLFYRWEINDAGDGLESISGGCYTGNALTVNTTKNTSADGTLNNFVALMANEVTLRHAEPWVIEWKASGDWSGMLLSHLSGISQNNNDAGGHSIFRTAANDNPTTRQGIAIGAYKDADLSSGGYAHFGVDKPGVANYVNSTARTYRLENRLENGIWLVINGNTEIAMTTAFGVTTEATAEWLKTEDFAFNAIGTGAHPIRNMKLEYLEIMVNGECDHIFGDWSIADQMKQRVCSTCGKIDSRAWVAYRWELNDARDALVSRDDGVYTDNDLTLQVNSDLNSQIVDGLITGYGAAMAEGVTLKHDEPWVIEWRSSGDWKGMLLADITPNSVGHNYYAATGGNYIFRNGNTNLLDTRPGVTLGVYMGNNDYDHVGVSKETTKNYMSVMRTFRLENHLNQDGSNMIYLVIDGGEGIALTESNFDTVEAEPATWLSGRDFYFDAIGVAAQPLNNIKLEYLQIFANGECEHSYGDWKTVSGKKLKECAMCGDTQAWEAYRWEINDAGNGLESITTGSYTENAVNKISGSIANDTFASYVGQMANGVTLEHDKEWVIEWEASGNWNGMLLCDIDNEGTIRNGANYIFRTSDQKGTTPGIVVGAYKDATINASSYAHFGVNKTTIAAYMKDATNNFRLENRINNGTNAIWLVINDAVEFEMTEAFTVTTEGATAESWMNSTDLYFNGFGKTGHTLNGMKLEYLEILVDGECDHNYGEWKLVNGEKQRTCADCGRIDVLKAFRWEMNDAGNALESVTTGGYTQNNLTLNTGTGITNTIEGGKINKFSAMLDTGFLLKHDEAWVIQWQSKGDWDGMLFCDLGTKITNPEVGGNYLFRSSSNAGPAFGAYATINTSFANFGIAAATSAQYMTANNTYTYRLENRIDAEGNNKVYLVVVEANAEYLLDQSLTKNVTEDPLEWFNGRDFYFDAIGTGDHALNNIYLNYLEVYVNGNGHVHSFGEWAMAEDALVKRSCSCGETEIAAVAVDDAGVYTGFATLEEALQAAASSAFDVYVMLFADQEMEDFLDLPENVGIDLNGYNLTAAGLVSNGYGIVNRTSEEGKLSLPKDAFAPSNTENADYLPIWNGEDGYVFINSSDVAAFRAAGAAPANGEATFFFRPEHNAEINSYLAAGADVSGVKLCVQINYTRDGVPKSVVGVYNDELIAKFYEGYDPETGTYTKAFKLSLTGVEGVTDLSYEIYYEAQGVHVTIAEYTPEVSAGE